MDLYRPCALTAGLIIATVFCRSPSIGHSHEPPAAEDKQTIAPRKTLIFELRTRSSGSDEDRGFSVETIEEIEAGRGDVIGRQAWPEKEKNLPVFTLMAIADADHVKIGVSSKLEWGSETVRDLYPYALLAAGGNLCAHTRTVDAGIAYTLRISDLASVPRVKADSPEVIAAISSIADIVKDARGSIQFVGPPGSVNYEHNVDGKQRNKLQRWRTTDANFRQNLAKLNNLRHLDLSSTTTLDDDPDILEHLPRLIQLNLATTQITDAGLKHLAGLQRLEELDLTGTSVSDGGVPDILKLPRLKLFKANSTRITREGLWALRSVLPPHQSDPKSGSRPWGMLTRAHSSAGIEQYANDARGRGRDILSLLVLGCDLSSDESDNVCEASLPVPSNGKVDICQTIAQTEHALKLLAQVGPVTAVTFKNPSNNPSGQSIWLNDKALSPLAGLSHLRELDVSQCGLTEAAWSQVARATQLKALSLRGAAISEEMLRQLHNSLPNCVIAGTPAKNPRPPVTSLPDVELWQALRAQFQGNSDREIVRAQRSYAVSDDANSTDGADWLSHRLVDARKQWRAVRIIAASQCDVRYDYELDASGRPIAEAKIAVPAALRELLGDDFFYSVVSVSGDAVLHDELRGSGRKWDNDGWLMSLTDLPRLSYLRIGCLRKKTGFDYLAHLRNLRTLDLSYPEITGEGLEALSDLPQFHALTFFGAEGLTAAGLSTIARLPHLDSLEFLAARAPDLDRLRLEKLPKLKRFAAEELTDDGLRTLSGLPELTELNMSNSPKVTDAGLRQLAALKLVALDITGTGVTSGGIESLKSWPSLRHLGIEGSQARACGMEKLSKLKQLTTLEIRAPGNFDLAALRRAMPNCDIRSRPITYFFDHNGKMRGLR